MMLNNWVRNDNLYHQDSINNAAHHVRRMGDVRSMAVALPSHSLQLKTLVKAFIAFLVTVATLFGSSISLTPAHADVSRPTLPLHSDSSVKNGNDLKWVTVPGLKAIWNPAAKISTNHYLNIHSGYWGDSNRTKDSDNHAWPLNNLQHKGFTFDVVGESYGFTFSNNSDITSNMNSYKTRGLLAIQQTSRIAPWGGLLTGIKWPFSEVVVGHIGGLGDSSAYNPTDPYRTKRLSLLMWDSENTPSCTVFTNAVYRSMKIKCNNNYSIVFRVDDGDSKVKIAFSPRYTKTDHGTDWTTNTDPSQKVGGQMDPRTGFVYYMVDRVNYLDEYGPADGEYANRNNGNANCQIVVWDPLTGDYVLSKEIQPDGMEQRSYLSQTNNSWMNDGPEVYSEDSKTRYVNNGKWSEDFRPCKGLFLDSEGNPYLLVTTSNTATEIGSGYDDTSDMDVSLVRINPYRNSAGNFLNPNGVPNKYAKLTGDVIENNWTYQVVSKIGRSEASTGLSFTDGAFRSVGLVNGQIASIGYGTPHGSSPTHNTFGTMLMENPYSHYENPSKPYQLGYYQLSSTSNDDWKDSDNDFNFNSPGDHFTDWSKDHYVISSITSASTINVIHGTVYWDKNGDSKLKPDQDDPDNPRLQGQTMALYNYYSGNLLNFTTTNNKGSYSFFAPFDSGFNQFLIRLVQPQVPIETDNTKLTDNKMLKTVTMSDGSSVHSINILDSDGKRLGIDKIRNAVQTWARASHKESSLGDTTSASEEAACIDSPSGVLANGITCYGAVDAPYIDRNITTIGSKSGYPYDDDIPIHTILKATYDDDMMSYGGEADFAVSAAGSYGDANQPPFNTTNAKKGPYFTGTDPNGLHLGVKIGNYTDSPTDPNGENHDVSINGTKTDDGASFVLDSSDSHYVQTPSDLKITVSGREGTPYYIEGWLSSVNSSTSNGKPIWNDVPKPDSKFFKYSTTDGVHDYGGGRINSSGHYTFTLRDAISNTVGSSRSTARALAPGSYLLRIVAAPAELVEKKLHHNLHIDNLPDAYYLDSDNSNGEYDGALPDPTDNDKEADQQYWTYPGEVEDYLIRVKSDNVSIVRFQSLIGRQTGSMTNPISIAYTDGNKNVTNIVKKYNVFSPETTNYNLDSPTFTGDTKLSDQFKVNYGSDDTETFSTTFNNGDRGLWYDSTYKNPKGISPDVGTSGEGPWNNPYKSGVACFEKNQVASNEASDAENNPGFPIGINVSAEEGQPVKITLARSEVGTGTIITCQVPFTYSQFTLPLAGHTIPWASVVGMTVLLLGIAGIAFVLVRRK